MAVETDAPPESPDRPRPERGRIGRAARRFRRAMPSAPVALACIAVGALLAGSLPPWGVWPLAFVGIAGLDVLLGGRSRGSRAGRMGFVALTLFGISLFWIKDLSAPGYVIAIFAFAAMFAAVGTVVPPGRGRHVALPGAWVVAEAWKGHWPFGGVPISDLAIGQVTGPLADLARLGGVELLSGATVAVGVILAAFIVGSARGRVAGGVALVALVALTALSSVAPHGHDVAHPVRIAAVQGGGPQGTRAIFTDMDKVFQRHLDASDSIRRRVDVIVWPEDVVDLDSGDIADADSGHGTDLSALARDKNATVIAGVVEDSGPTRFLNFSVVIHPDGTFGDRYEKVHRVPYGEYVPLRSLVTPFAGPALTQRDAVVGKGPARLRTAHGTFGVVISWEVFFSGRARAAVRDGGEILLNPTNGSTYTGTLVQTQQVAASRLRALETGRWTVQVAPTGFSAIISPNGTLEQRSSISKRDVLYADVPRRSGFTLYTRMGSVPPFVLAVILIGAGWVIERRSRSEGLPPKA